MNFLTNKSTKTGRLITVRNYCKYQDEENKSNKADNKDLTKMQQRPNKEITPNKNDNNDKNTYKDNSTEYRLAKYLFEKIRKLNPGHRKPGLQLWAKYIDYMIRIDKRRPADIKKVIDWCQADDFWQKVILSTSNLRSKFDSLIIRTNEKERKGEDEVKYKNASEHRPYKAR